MKSSRGSKNQLRWHVGIALTAAVFCAAASGGASGQVKTTYAVVSVLPYGTAPPTPTAKCGGQSTVYEICVDPEPILTPSVSEGIDVRIVWNLDGDSGWSFDKNKGINIPVPKNWKPKWVSTTQYIATNKKENGAQVYMYKINLMTGSTNLSWDPTIMN
jgi:hypothetical protein